jgi:hypothetical protein
MMNLSFMVGIYGRKGKKVVFLINNQLMGTDRTKEKKDLDDTCNNCGCLFLLHKWNKRSNV